MYRTQSEPSLREGHQVEPRDGLGPHREAIAQGVRRGDLAVVVGIVHDRREEIHRLNDGQILAQLVDAGVVSRVGPVEKVRIAEGLKAAQRFSQVLRTQFRPSPARLDEAGEEDFSLRSSRQFFSPRP